MTTMNPFDILGSDDNDDSSQLIAAAAAAAEKPTKKGATAAPGAIKPVAKLPSKPLPPSEAVREARNEGGRGGGGGGGRGYGRPRGAGGGGFNRDFRNDDNAEGNNGFSDRVKPSESGESGKSFERRGGGGPHGPYRGGGGGGFNRDFRNDDNAEGNNGFSDRVKPSEGGESGKSFERRGGGGPRGPYRGGRRGDFGNGESGEGERTRRPYERRSGTGRGSELKRDGSGRGNWGTTTDDIAPEETAVENEKVVVAEKQPGEDEAVDANKETPEKESEEKEPEEKEMTLEEYEKVLEEKRKALIALKAEERKVDLDKELQSMQLLSNKKKNNDEIFIKLGSEKDKRKEAADKEEKSKKSMSINSFLKPAEGDAYYGRGGRGRGRGRGPRGGGYAGGGSNFSSAPAPAVGDIGNLTEFPSLGGK